MRPVRVHGLWMEEGRRAGAGRLLARLWAELPNAPLQGEILNILANIYLPYLTSPTLCQCSAAETCRARLVQTQPDAPMQY